MQSTPIALPSAYGQAQRERVAMTPAGHGTPEDVCPHSIQARGGFARLVDSLAGVAAEHDQGTGPKNNLRRINFS